LGGSNQTKGGLKGGLNTSRISQGKTAAGGERGGFKVLPLGGREVIEESPTKSVGKNVQSGGGGGKRTHGVVLTKTGAPRVGVFF